MSNVPGDLKYSKDHEWIRVEEDGTCTIGVTDHAQAALGDLVFVELPEVGSTLAEGDACAVVESVKAASDVYSPLTGEVTAVNDGLTDAPELVNTDAYGVAGVDLAKAAEIGRGLSEGDAALVKGSRVAQLERLVEQLPS